MEASWWNWYRLFSCFYRPGEIPASIVHTRCETIASSFFNPDAGRNSPRGTADLPQRNVLPPRCLTLRLFFFLEPLYPFQRCSIRSLPSLLASFYRFYSSFFPSLSQVVHSFLGLSSPRSYYPPLFSHRATLKLAFSLLSSEAADFPHFTFQSHGGCDFLPHFHSDNIEGSADEQSE